MEILFLSIAASMFLNSKSNSKAKYRKGGSILSTLSNVGTFIYQTIQMIGTIISISVVAIQMLIKFLVPVFTLLFKGINKFYLLITKKQKVTTPIAPKVTSIKSKTKLPSNVILFSKYSNRSIS